MSRPLVLAAVLPALALAGCAGTPEVNGAVGITVTADGAPVAVVEICRGSVQELGVAGPNRGQQPNEVHADLVAAAPVRASTTVVLAAPGEDWQGTPLRAPLDDDLYVVLAGDHEEDSELTQADFRVAELDALTPDTVQYSVYDDDRGPRSVQAPLADFHDLACRTRG
ncbi:hypothetical protein GCU67_01665 [Modestobacter muralis]|uniref:Uncharacterized protein n=1 Tax=Modestobacter muralis TaxID=1608614 RepID=A0A6P0EMV7_9ACTN|nr:hypothetical protein [Modestobacter muralis]NEK92882.1 hypothetical protein [Modestobacter muralis]NEN49649.1 hypothetical protein [Modestobacter muralis]